MEIRLEDMKWPEVGQILREPNVLLMPIGSTEQHGLHLPLNVDSRCATYIAEQAARKVVNEREIRILVAPTIQYTVVTEFSEFPGTIGISLDTEIRVIREITQGFIKQGFRKIILVNGHGPNTVPISAALHDISIEFPDIGLYGINWWSLVSDIIMQVRKSGMGLHADELETSICLVIQPEKVESGKSVKDSPKLSLSSRWAIPDLFNLYSKVFYHSPKNFPKYTEASGVMGDPTVATKQTGETVIMAAVDELSKLIVEIATS